MRAAFAMFAPLEGIAEGDDLRLGPHRRPTTRCYVAGPRPRAARWPSDGLDGHHRRGPGIMQAAAEGAGPDRAIGVSIRLPFEEAPSDILAGGDRLVTMKYFFTRKLMLMKESSAFVVPARRLRHPGRDLRAAHAPPDRQGDPGARRAPRRARRHATGRAGSSSSTTSWSAPGSSRRRTTSCSSSPTTSTRRSTRSSGSGAATTRSGGRATGWWSGCATPPTDEEVAQLNERFADLLVDGADRAHRARCPPRSPTATTSSCPASSCASTARKARRRRLIGAHQRPSNERVAERCRASIAQLRSSMSSGSRRIADRLLDGPSGPGQAALVDRQLARRRRRSTPSGARWPGRPAPRRSPRAAADVVELACHRRLTARASYVLDGLPDQEHDVPDDLHEWVSFEDPHEDRTWVFDVTFLTSPWTCIYGRGLPGRPHRAGRPSSSRGAAATAPTSPTRTTQATMLAARRAPAPRRSGSSTTSGSRTAGPTKTNKAGEIGPASSTAPASSSTGPGFAGGAGCALHTARARRRRAPPRLEARGLLAAARCASRTTPTTTATSPTRCASGSAATGARAAPSSTGGAPRTPRPSSTASPST